MKSHYYALIMAGGSGTRLWPMSRQHTPKQLLPLIEDCSLYQTSVKRLNPIFKPEQIYVVTGEQYVETLHAESPEIPRKNFITEPYGKNTAPAIALALATIYHRDPLATVAILTADHHISKVERFQNVLETSYDIAQENYIVTIGISPSYPATGYGYIQQGEALGETHYHALAFTEKPELALATRFLTSGDYSWNSGMFIWKVKQAIQEFQQQQPAIYEVMMKLAQAIEVGDYEAKLSELWEGMPKISIDYAIMEDANNIAVIPTDIGWSDVGSWESLFDVLDQDADGNCVQGKATDNKIMVDTHNSMIYSDRMAVTIGVDDLIIVDTEDVIFVCHKKRSQEVRDIVKRLESNGHRHYL